MWPSNLLIYRVQSCQGGRSETRGNSVNNTHMELLLYILRHWSSSNITQLSKIGEDWWRSKPDFVESQECNKSIVFAFFCSHASATSDTLGLSSQFIPFELYKRLKNCYGSFFREGDKQGAKKVLGGHWSTFFFVFFPLSFVFFKILWLFVSKVVAILWDLEDFEVFDETCQSRCLTRPLFN